MRDGQLCRNLLEPPASAAPEVEVLRALRGVEERWKIEIIEAVDESAPPTEDRGTIEVEKAGTGATAALEGGLRTIRAIAYVAVQQEKAKEYASLPKNGELALLEGTWKVIDDSARGLCLQPVPVDWLPPNIRPLLNPLYVVIHSEGLTDQGRTRLVAGSHIWAAVLGTASFEGRRADQHVGEARVAPIAVIGDLAKP